jgi:F-type H+-transporting ATPase subunit delta
MTSRTSPGLFARRYAGVLFDVVEARGEAAKAVDDLEALAAAVASSAELRQVLDIPSVAPVTKGAIMDAIAGQLGAGAEVRRLLGLLAARDRLRAIGDVAAAFTARVNSARRTVEADVVTATPLSDERRASLARALGDAAACHVTIKERVDASIIGGVVARVGSLVFDGSVLRQVERLREQLASGGAGGR